MSFPARRDGARLLLAAVLALGPACAATAASPSLDDDAEYIEQDDFTESPMPFSREDVRQAAAKTRADLERPVNRPKEDKEPAKRRDDSLSPMTGLEEALRLAMWVFGGLLVIYVLLNLRRWIKVRGAAEAPRTRREPLPPGTVSGLDIRPASMPEDVAAEAARLWREGAGRAALALLYRSALSRMVHGHAVPIRAASTERECVALSARALPPASASFFASLVGAWQLAAYGASLPDASRMQALFDDFERMLPPGASSGAAP